MSAIVIMHACVATEGIVVGLLLQGIGLARKLNRLGSMVS
jgi:hypothetical protein